MEVDKKRKKALEKHKNEANACQPIPLKCCCVGALFCMCVFASVCAAVCVWSWHRLMVLHTQKPSVGVARETEQHETLSAGAVPRVRLLEPPTNAEGGEGRRGEESRGEGRWWW